MSAADENRYSQENRRRKVCGYSQAGRRLRPARRVMATAASQLQVSGQAFSREQVSVTPAIPKFEQEVDIAYLWYAGRVMLGSFLVCFLITASAFVGWYYAEPSVSVAHRGWVLSAG